MVGVHSVVPSNSSIVYTALLRLIAVKTKKKCVYEITILIRVRLPSRLTLISIWNPL